MMNCTYSQSYHKRNGEGEVSGWVWFATMFLPPPPPPPPNTQFVVSVLIT